MNDIIETEVVEEEELKVVEKEAKDKLLDKLSAVDSLSVETEGDYLAAVELLQDLENTYDLIDSIVDPLRDRAYQHYKEVRDYKNSILNPADEAINHLRSEIETYAIELERSQIESAEDVDPETEEEFERALEQGDQERARELLEEIESDKEETQKEGSVPEADGISFRESWKAEVEDEDALIDALATGAIPRGIVKQLVQVPQSNLNSLARQFHRELNIPGVRVYKDKTVVNRG